MIPKSCKKKKKVLLISTFINTRNRPSLGLATTTTTKEKGGRSITCGVDSVSLPPNYRLPSSSIRQWMMIALSRAYFYPLSQPPFCYRWPCDLVLCSQKEEVCWGSFWESFPFLIKRGRKSWCYPFPCERGWDFGATASIDQVIMRDKYMGKRIRKMPFWQYQAPGIKKRWSLRSFWSNWVISHFIWKQWISINFN